MNTVGFLIIMKVYKYRYHNKSRKYVVKFQQFPTSHLEGYRGVQKYVHQAQQSTSHRLKNMSRGGQPAIRDPTIFLGRVGVRISLKKILYCQVNKTVNSLAETRRAYVTIANYKRHRSQFKGKGQDIPLAFSNSNLNEHEITLLDIVC